MAERSRAPGALRRNADSPGIRANAGGAGRLQGRGGHLDVRARCASQRDRYPHGAPAARNGQRSPLGPTQLFDPDRPRSGDDSTPLRLEYLMKTKLLTLAVIAVAILGAGGYGIYALGMRQGMGMSAAASAAESGATAAGNTTKPGSADPATGKKVLYWHDPMVPGQKFDKPGKSPFMDMMLVPVYADGDSDQGQVTVSPRVQQSLGVRTAEVEQGTMAPQIEAVGSIAFNERDQYVIQARATGYVERLYVRATLDRVRQGQPLVDLYVPDWVAAQEEVLSVQRMRGADLAALADVAR